VPKRGQLHQVMSFPLLKDAAALENPNYSTLSQLKPAAKVDAIQNPTYGILNEIKTRAEQMDNIYDTVLTNEAALTADSTANVASNSKDNFSS